MQQLSLKASQKTEHLTHLLGYLHALLQLCRLAQQCSELACLTQCCCHLVHHTTGGSHTKILQEGQHSTAVTRLVYCQLHSHTKHHWHAVWRSTAGGGLGV